MLWSTSRQEFELVVKSSRTHLIRQPGDRYMVYRYSVSPHRPLVPASPTFLIPIDGLLLQPSRPSTPWPTHPPSSADGPQNQTIRLLTGATLHRSPSTHDTAGRTHSALPIPVSHHLLSSRSKRLTIVSSCTAIILIHQAKHVGNFVPVAPCQPMRRGKSCERTHVFVKCFRAYANPSMAFSSSALSSCRCRESSSLICSMVQLGLRLMMNRDKTSSCSVGISPAY